LLDEHGNLKVSDFGLSSLLVGDSEGNEQSRTQLLHTTCGTPNYVAPEVLADQGYDGKKADVWSMGVILYVLLAGFLPFDETSITALFEKIQKAEFSYPSWFSPEVREILDCIMVADPKKRVGLKELRALPWLQSAVILKDETPVPTHSSAIRDEHHDEDSDDDYAIAKDEGPATLDAFEFVAQSGGFAMSRYYILVDAICECKSHIVNDI
jgi:serine/threonine protein kinase